MTPAELRVFYEQRRQQFDASLKEAATKINLVSNIRLGVALLFLLLLYFAFSNTDLFYILPALLVIFIILVRRHATLFEQKTHLENLVNIHWHELQALEGNFSVFDNGAEFIEPHHHYTHDLDIFGEGSLFQYLNRITTRSGKKRLAERLSAPLSTVDEIRQYQDAVRELAGKNDFRHHFQATGLEIDEQPHDQQQLADWVNQKSFLHGKPFYRWVLAIFPVITVVLVVASFFIDYVSPFAILFAALQWAFLGLHLKRVNQFHQYISRKKNILANYARMLFQVEKEKFTSPEMQKLGSQAREADRKVQRLASLVRAFDARMNSMTNFVVNSLLLYDLQCVYRLEQWKDENATSLQTWLNVITETEVLCTLGTYSFNNKSAHFPAVNTIGKLSANAMGHPLIAEAERVLNDIELDSNRSILIITGANMAGKSTFLRTLGVNVVLALTGAPVCAHAFECPLISMRSGMRTADSLKDHQSYFYAELDRLKSIMDELRSGKRLLVLLDEILKGTNSTDKQAGSIALVKQLAEQSSLVLIATHDLALGDLEKQYPERVRNFCFEANIENDQLSFDYKLKPGLATKMNATFLMRKMGIIPA